MRRPCAAIFMTLVIQWNGDVTTCCHDPKLDCKIGNVNVTSLDELWNSDEMTKRRIMQIKGDFSYPKICNNCKNVDGIEISHEEIIDYLISIGREDLIEQYAKRHTYELKPKYKVLAKTKEMLEIDAFTPKSASWDKGSGKYLGEDGFRKGYTFIYGKNIGFFEYELPISKGEYEIELNLASPDWQEGKKTEAEITLNGKIIAKITIQPLAEGKGECHKFRITAIEGIIHLLKIKSLEGSAGICIMGNPLENESEKGNLRIRKIK